MTTITSNGSKWAGESPDTVDELCAVLQSHTLDRIFEGYGNFVIADAGEPLRFWGNFFDVSHVFSIDTDEPAVIERLTALIRANQQTAAYLSQDSPEQRKQAEDARNAALDAKRLRNRRARGIIDTEAN